MLELMFTLALVAVLTTIALPSFKSILGDSALVTTTNDLVSSIHMARSESVKRGLYAGVCPVVDAQSTNPVCSQGGGWTNGWMVFVDVNASGAFEPLTDEVVVVKEQRTAAFSISPDTVFTSLIYFDSNGASINPALIPISGNIKVAFSDEGARQVSVSANGRVATTEIPL